MSNENVSEVRKRVAAKWSNYKFDSHVESTDIETQPNKKLKVSNSKKLEKIKHGADKDVIDLTQTSSDEQETEIEEFDISEKSHHEFLNPITYEDVSPFKLFQSTVYDNFSSSNNIEHADQFINLHDIFHDRRLRKTLLFSFQFDLEFLLNHFILDQIDSILFVAQKGTILPPTSPHLLLFLDKIQEIVIDMPPYTCHHSKMIINIYEDSSCKIFLPSCNFTYHEAHLPQQVCWISPSLPLCDSKLHSKTNGFEESLLKYLSVYKQKRLNDFISSCLQNINFESLSNVDFIFSCPSSQSETCSGLMLLQQKLTKTKFFDTEKSEHHYLCQSSTIGLGSKKACKCHLTHEMIPLWENLIRPTETNKTKMLSTQELMDTFHSKRIIPYIVYPTFDEIEESPSGTASSGYFHFHHTDHPNFHDMLLNKFKILYKQDPSSLSQERKATPCHSKFYMRATKNANDISKNVFHNLDWCLYTSSNLSHNAWGGIKSKPRNFEVGVLYQKSERQNIECKSFVDLIYRKGQRLGGSPTTKLSQKDRTVIIKVPFSLSLQKYDPKHDVAFDISQLS